MKSKPIPITVIGTASAVTTAQVTLTVRKGMAQADIHIHPHGKTRSKGAPFALLNGVLHPQVVQKHLQDFVVHLEGMESVSELMVTPLAMGHMPVLVAQKVRECTVAVLARNKLNACALDHQILTVATLLACMREIWDAEAPGRGDALAQTETRAAMGDLADRKPQLAQSIKNLLGWGNDDEQSEDQVKWLRKTVRKQLKPTTHVLRLMRDNPFGGTSGGAAVAPNPSSSPAVL